MHLPPRLCAALLLIASLTHGLPVKANVNSSVITVNDEPELNEVSGSNTTKPTSRSLRDDDITVRPSPIPTNSSNSSAGIDHLSAKIGENNDDDSNRYETDNQKVKNPCKRQCKPSIDKNYSVIAAFGRHRAQAALIGDYGKGPKACTDDNESERANNATHYTWTIDWGDEESYTHREETVWPYQAVHEYHKKGKYSVDVMFCHHLEGCEPSCAKHQQLIRVKG